jgi:iron complex transport system ATP-binding protein
MMPEVPLVEIHNATIWRGSTRVFENLDLEIQQHERVAIVGPNGSGKTTLLKAINRELYPVANPASVFRILGRESWNVWELRKRVGIVSQDLQQRYTQTTTALEVVVSGFHSSIGIHGTLAERVDTDQIEAAEPTAGLDFSASFDYLERVRRLANAGRNIIVVTHHLNEIPPEIDRVVLLRDGRIAADGSKQAVLTDEILGEVYETPIRVIEIDGYYLAYPGQNAKT